MNYEYIVNGGKTSRDFAIMCFGKSTIRNIENLLTWPIGENRSVSMTHNGNKLTIKAVEGDTNK